MPFVKGQSGNPYGRPPGAQDFSTRSFLQATRSIEKEEEMKDIARSEGYKEYEARNRGSNNGGYIVVWFIIALLVIFLLDHFVLEGKLLAYIRSYFSEEKEPEEKEEIIEEEKNKTFGFENRSLETL
jgi:hypothetical protein